MDSTTTAALTSNLKFKHKRFVDEYLICQNAAQAARIVGYKGKNVSITAHQLLKKPKVALYYEQRKRELTAAVEVKAEEIRAFWKKLMNDDSANSSDRLRASEYLAKEKGMFKADLSETPVIIALTAQDRRIVQEEIGRPQDIVVEPLAIETQIPPVSTDIATG